MWWQFWKKNSSTADLAKLTIEKLTRPKDLPDQIGMHLVANMRKDPDWVWSLKAVERIKPDTKHIADIRIFDPNKVISAKVDIRNYHSLNDHPELIVFEGWINKKLRKFQIEEKGVLKPETKAA
jgi:hypothetical protein